MLRSMLVGGRMIARRRAVLAGAFIAVVVAPAVAPASAQAACSENGSLFWKGGGGTTTAIGNWQKLPIFSHTKGGCGNVGDIKAGGTVHISGPPGNNLVEVGWRDRRGSSGATFELFTERVLSGQAFVANFPNNPCAVNGTTVELRLIRAGTQNVWTPQYACNGSLLTLLGGNLPTNFWSGSPRVETFRFGPPGDGGYISDTHNSLNYRNSAGTWVGNFGAMSCALGMSDTYGVPSGNPATSWHTATSGTTC